MKKATLLAFLLAVLAPMMSAWAETHSKHYGKISVSASGSGTVYLSTQKTAASGQPTDSWDCNSASAGDSKTYYCFAKPGTGYKFVKWIDSDGKVYESQANGASYYCTVAATADSENKEVPTETKMTAVFEEIKYKSVTYECTGGSYKVNGTQITSGKTESVENATPLKLTEPSPNSNYEFVGWYRRHSNGIKEYLAYMNSFTALLDDEFTGGSDSVTIGADFAEIKTFTLNFIEPNNGTMKYKIGTGSDVTVGANSSETLRGAISVTLSATPSEDNRAAKWYTTDENDVRTYFSVDANVTKTFSDNATIGVVFIPVNTDIINAIEAAQSSDTHMAALSADAEVVAGTTVVIPDGITIDLGGHTLYVDGTLTVNGTLENGSVSKCTKMFKQTGHDLQPRNPCEDIRYWVTAPTTVSSSFSGYSGIVSNHVTVVNGYGDVHRKVLSNTSATIITCTVDSSVAINHVTGILNTGHTSISKASSSLTSQMTLLLSNVTDDDPNSKVASDRGILDCAGKKYTIPSSCNTSGTYFHTILNGEAVCDTPSSKGGFYGHWTCLGCTSISIANMVNKSDYATNPNWVHVYDCTPKQYVTGMEKTSGKGSRVCYYSGGPYKTADFNGEIACYEIYGGYWTSEPDSARIAPDLKSTHKFFQHTDTYWYLEPKQDVSVAKIGKVPYDTFKEAFDAAVKAGSATITLLRNSTVNERLILPKDHSIRVELAGCTLTAASQEGFLVNYGAFEVGDMDGGMSKCGITSANGYLFENHGTIEVAYGSYQGAIKLNSGMFTTHHGTFNCTLMTADGVDPLVVSDIRGGAFSHQIGTEWRKPGYRCVAYNSKYWVGRFPDAIVTDVSTGTASKTWQCDFLPPEDLALYVNANGSRSSYTDANWYKRAELKAGVLPWSAKVVDCQIMFDRTVAAKSIEVTMPFAPPQSLETQSVAGMWYSELIPYFGTFRATPYTYSFYLEYYSTRPAPTLGFTEKNQNNNGTVFTLKMQFYNGWNGDKTNPQVSANSWAADIATLRYMLGGKKAAIDRNGSRLPYDSLAAAVSAANDGERVLVGADTDSNVTLSKAGTFTIDPYGFNWTGNASITDNSLVLKSQTEVASLAEAQGVASAKAVVYVVARKVAVPTAVAGLVYDGTEKTGVAAGMGYTLSGVAAATAAGSYTATATLDANYVWADESTGTKTIEWSIAPAPLTVTATAVSKTYGQTDPALTYTVEGLLGEDSMSGELARAVGEDVGTYAINQGTLTAGPNYAITYTGAYFTIAPPDSVAKVDIANVPDAWMEANGFDSNSSAEEVQTELCKNDDNGIAKWENVVMGQNGADKPAIETSTNGTATVADMVVSFTPPSDIGYTVKYAFDEVNENGTVKEEGGVTNSPALNLERVAVAGTPAYFKMRAVLESNDEKHTFTTNVPVDKVIGVMKVDSDATFTILAVPWKAFDGGNVKVSELVHAASLSTDDMLYAYDDNGNLESWRVKDGVWVSMTESKDNQQSETYDPAGFGLARGKGVWLKRENVKSPIYLMGQPTTETATTTLTAATDENTPSWNLLASPNFETVNIASKFKDNTGDEIIVPTAGTPKHYTYNSTKGGWGYPGATVTNSVTLPKQTTPITIIKTEHKTGDTTITPGTGFWYLNKGKAKTISW